MRVNGQKQRGYWRHHASLSRIAKPEDDIEVYVYHRFNKVKDWNGIYNSQLVATVEFDLRYYRQNTVNHLMQYMSHEVVDEGIQGHPLTRAQAIEIGESFVRRLTDEPFALFAVGAAPGLVFDSAQDATTFEGTDESYTLAFTRCVEGAPLLFTNSDAMDASSWRADLYTPPVGYEQILMAMDREGHITTFMWSNPYAVSEEKTARPLLEFDSILSVAQYIMPLKYQWYEQEDGEVRIDISRIDLGYMALLQRDKLSFALTPVWNFYGNMTDASEDLGEQSVRPLLTVNAVDGTVIDLEYGY